jgi:hypothetical protein
VGKGVEWRDGPRKTWAAANAEAWLRDRHRPDRRKIIPPQSRRGVS